MNQSLPERQFRSSVTSGRMSCERMGCIHSFATNVPYIVFAPAIHASMVYWPAARSLCSRAARSLDAPARYSTVMPKRSLNACGIAVRVSALGLPLITNLPSAFAAATSASHSAFADGADVGGAAGASPLLVLQPSTPSAAAVPATATLALRIERR